MPDNETIKPFKTKGMKPGKKEYVKQLNVDITKAKDRAAGKEAAKPQATGQMKQTASKKTMRRKSKVRANNAGLDYM